MVIKQITDSPKDEFVFEVELDKNHQYTVWFSKDYYQKLTAGQINADQLVKKSFEFLLEHEGPESILPEFELSLIGHYFPQYEKIIEKQ